MVKLRRSIWLFSCLIGGLSACQSEADLSTPTGIVAATAVSPTSFTRIDLPNDLHPRGVSDDWYVASAIDGSTLYLMDIESGQRTVISEHGGWGAVVVTQTTVSWIDDNGHVQQYNIVSGETSQLTQAAAERSNLVGNARWLVWQDKRNETGDANYYAADIYAYDLSSGEEVAVAAADGVQQQPALDNDLIVWADNRNSPVRGQPLEGCGNCPDNPFDIYSFNLQTGETAVLAADGKHNAQPAINSNRVAWITFGEGIKVLDLTTGVVETAVPYQQGLTQPWLVGDQLRYVVKQDCDVIMVSETGQEIPANTGAFLFDLASHDTMQLTSYKEPLVLNSQANMLIAEGCMTGFDTIYLLRNLHLPTAESPIQRPAVSPMPTVESVPVEVTRMVVTAVPSPTPAVCTPLPEGMIFTVTPASDTAITLELTGLQPGESLHFIFSWEGDAETSEIELYDLPPVGSDGRYTDTINLQQAGEDPHTWEIKAIHARGVACTEITLPEDVTAVTILGNGRSPFTTTAVPI